MGVGVTPPRFVCVGANQESEVVLRDLIDIGANVVAVVTRPSDSSSGASDYVDLRGLCREAGIAVIETLNINESHTIDEIRDMDPDYVYTLGWSQLFGDELLALPSGYVVGSHPSPLPTGRGRAPVPWTILEGASASAVTLFRMDVGVDAGPILMQRMFDIPAGSNVRALYDLVAKNLSAAFLRLYEMHAGGETIVEIAQDSDAATYRARRTPADGHLDFEKPAEQLDRLIRATSHPYPGAYTYYEGRLITVWQATLEDVPAYVGSSGQILLRAGDRLLVQASDRPLWIWDLTSNGQAVPVSDVRVGHLFGYRVEDTLHQLEHAVEVLGREANR